MTTAAGTILVLRYGTILAANVVTLAFEIISVTGRAERRVLEIAPGNRTADHRTVTAVTARICAVIARVVPLRAMFEDGRCPAVDGMTDVALFSRS